MGRFNVGGQPQCGVSPDGTAERTHILSRPFGTRGISRHQPNVETLGYYRESLRDEDRFLALDVSHGVESGSLSGRRPPDLLFCGEPFVSLKKNAIQFGRRDAHPLRRARPTNATLHAQRDI